MGFEGGKATGLIMTIGSNAMLDAFSCEGAKTTIPLWPSRLVVELTRVGRSEKELPHSDGGTERIAFAMPASASSSVLNVGIVGSESEEQAGNILIGKITRSGATSRSRSCGGPNTAGGETQMGPMALVLLS